ncbi:MAG: hypothetical protein LC798_14305 [Chloroflexi bacterium]|nr:hypothetical protein [Chloroflexota bacterium]
MRCARLAATSALVLASALSACLGSSPDCAGLPSRIELTVEGGTLTPNDPAVCRDRDVTLVLTTDADAVFHIHGYDEHVPATSVTPGAATEIAFPASRSGQYPIELHTEDDTAGVSVGIFTVHEP